MAHRRLADVRLPNNPASVPVARRLAAGLANLWGAQEHAERVELCASELGTNVILHAPGTEFRLIVRQDADYLRVEMHDAGRALPRTRITSDEDEHGRGLPLVDACSDEHSAYLTPTGKCVWFSVKVG